MKKMICHECGNEMTTIKNEPYHYKECGLDDVTIVGITLHKCEECGENYTSIPKVKELHNVIGELVCKKEGRLIKKEVRFLRKEMRMKGKEFALMLSVSAEHISRVENGSKPVSNSLGKLIRALYMIYSKEGQCVGEGTFHEITQAHDKDIAPFNIELNPTDWLAQDSQLYSCPQC